MWVFLHFLFKYTCLYSIVSTFIFHYYIFSFQKATINDSQRPAWYDEVRKWADASATSFLAYDTEPSPTGQNRIVNLGSCSGGWESDGNSPSYQSPGACRFMKDFQNDFSPYDRDYTMPSFNDGLTHEERWNKVISTSYKFLDSVQCESKASSPIGP